MTSPIITKIVENDICIGCGICASLCPHNVLKMSWNAYGEYIPTETATCIKKCDICLKTCPFTDTDDNEDTIGERLYGDIPGIAHDPHIGYYLTAYMGFSTINRPTSSSGGIATWLLEKLLTDDIVDRVICVSSTGKPDGLFNFQVFDSIGNLKSGAGSVYYPVEMSGVIRMIINEPGRYAITGLPCFIKAIRLAQRANTKLRERIIVTIGLVCGQMKSKHFTDYVASLAGVESDVTRVLYRGKELNQPVSNYHYRFTTSSGEEHQISWKDGISQAWVNRWFTLRACNYCDDIFAECADVTCMDAWLPELSQDNLGTSIVIIRSPKLLDVIKTSDEIQVKLIAIKRVIDSQESVCKEKRKNLAYHLLLDRQNCKPSLKKRVDPKYSINPFLIKEVILREKMRCLSRRAWVDHTEKGVSFLRLIQPCLDNIMFIKKIERIFLAPHHLIKIVKNK